MARKLAEQKHQADSLPAEGERTMTVLEKLSSLTASREQAEAELLQVARQLAQDPDGVSLEEVQSVLRTAGKSPAELEELVHYHQHRCELRAKAQAMTEAETRRRAVKAAITEAEAAFDEATRLHDETMRRLHGEMNGICRTLEDGSLARAELFRTCQNASLRAEYNRAAEACKANAARLRQIESELGKLEGYYGGHRSEPQPLRVERLTQEAAELTDEQPGLIAARDKLAEQIEAD